MSNNADIMNSLHYPRRQQTNDNFMTRRKTPNHNKQCADCNELKQYYACSTISNNFADSMRRFAFKIKVLAFDLRARASAYTKLNALCDAPRGRHCRNSL